MTQKPKVSVVIPAYNAMKYLPLTLVSALAQDYRDYEVVVIDDGSNDDIVSWLTARGDARVRLFSQRNGGLANARNRGIRESRGELIAFLDADDIWLPSKLSRQVAVIEQSDAVGVVYTGVEIIDAEGRSRGRRILHRERGEVWRTLVLRNIVECGSTPMVRRACFERVGLFDESLGSHVEDRDMWLRIAAHYLFDTVPETLVLYRQHAAGASANWRAMERSTFLVNEKAIAANPSGLSEVELRGLKRRSYALGYLRLAWKPLQGASPDLGASLKLARNAARHDKAILFSKAYGKLFAAQALLAAVGAARFPSLRAGRGWLGRAAKRS